MSLFEKIQELIESEVQRELMKYAQVISKKHDISLKLLLQDIHARGEVQADTPAQATGQCLGVTAKKTQCTFSGKHGGYCARHVSQRKVAKTVVQETVEEKNPHVGHTMKECMFLAGCPACEKSRKSSQNLLIDI
jgi:hypothetical protein